MHSTSNQMDKVLGVLVEILSNCSNLGYVKDIADPSQKQPKDVDSGHYLTPLSLDDDFFVSDLSFWDA